MSALAVSFWELFLCGSSPKEKVDKKQAVVKFCGTIFRYQDSLAAFLCQNRRLFSCLTYVSHLLRKIEKKLTKETPSALTPRGRHCAWGTTFEKVDKTIAEFVRTKCATNQKLKYLLCRIPHFDLRDSYYKASNNGGDDDFGNHICSVINN